MIVLKIILWTLLAVLVIIAAALCVPTRLFIHYADDIILQIRYLFIKINIPITEEQKAARAKKRKRKIKAKPAKKVPEDNKKAIKKNKKTKNKKNKPNPAVKWLKGLWKKGRVEAITNAFKRIAELVGGLLKPIFKTFRIRRLDILIISASDNAADTAINYGKLCAGVYPALSIILNIVKYNDYNVNIYPDFDKKELEVDITAELSLIPWAVVFGAVKALVGFLRYKIRGEL
ncbi:MAG: DUF2953 domain-containing protein [Clostridia bacterium]|nr:DUF2953 domain-containing protein [Clostridia bacterium]